MIIKSRQYELEILNNELQEIIGELEKMDKIIISDLIEIPFLFDMKTIEATFMDSDSDTTDDVDKILGSGQFFDTPVAYVLSKIPSPTIRVLAEGYMVINDYASRPGLTIFGEDLEGLNPDIFQGLKDLDAISNIWEALQNVSDNIDENFSVFDEESSSESEKEEIPFDPDLYEYTVPPPYNPDTYIPYPVPPPVEPEAPDNPEVPPPYNPDTYGPYPVHPPVEEQSYSNPNVEVELSSYSKSILGYREPVQNVTDLIMGQQMVEPEVRTSNEVEQCCRTDAFSTLQKDYTGTIQSHLDLMIGQRVFEVSANIREARMRLSNEIVSFMAKPSRQERLAAIPPRNTTVNIVNHINVTNDVDIQRLIRMINRGLTDAMDSSGEGFYI